jgi:hypothetical protein
MPCFFQVSSVAEQPFSLPIGAHCQCGTSRWLSWCTGDHCMSTWCMQSSPPANKADMRLNWMWLGTGTLVWTVQGCMTHTALFRFVVTFSPLHTDLVIGGVTLPCRTRANITSSINRGAVVIVGKSKRITLPSTLEHIDSLPRAQVLSSSSGAYARRARGRSRVLQSVPRAKLGEKTSHGAG